MFIFGVILCMFIIYSCIFIFLVNDGVLQMLNFLFNDGVTVVKILNMHAYFFA